jgi:hypothetical protein
VAVGTRTEVVALSAFVLNVARAIVGRVNCWFLSFCLMAAIGSVVSARDMPAPPCAGPPNPAYPEAFGMPTIEVWLDQHTLENWDPPACLDWQDRPATALIAVSGLFRHDGTLEDLLARLGAVSRYMSIYYWSWSKQRWRHLFEEAAALSAPVRTAMRPDFKADEFREGNLLYILQNETGSVGEVIQRVSIIDRTEDGIEIGITNLSAARVAFLTLLDPGGSEVRLWIEREADDHWTYYSLARLSGTGLLARSAMKRSYVSRAEAMFRYLADVEGLRDVR